MDYIQIWKSRCYNDDIPDYVPDRLMNSQRVPSYKAIALCLLNNDHSLKRLGINIKISKYYYELKTSDNTCSKSIQTELF